MEKIREPFHNSQLDLFWDKLNIYHKHNTKFSLTENPYQNENNQYSGIRQQTYELIKLSENLFWGDQSEIIKIYIFNEFIDDNFEEAIQQLYKDKVILYYFKVKQHFTKHFYEHIQFILISPKNKVIYNFKKKQIQSTFDSNHLERFLKIFIKDQSIIDSYEKDINKDFLLNQAFSNNKTLLKYKSQNFQYPDGMIIRPIDQIGLNYYLCFESNFISYYGQLNEKYQKHGRGILFQTIWDDTNPNFSILQGNFKNGKKNGLMIKFNSRSENIQYGQEYVNDEFIKQVDLDDNGKVKVIEIKNTETQQKSTQEAPKKRRIIIMEEGVIINNIDKPLKENIQVKSNLFVKFNQQYSDNDEKILNSSRMWLTSSIIDGYAMYLQKKHFEEAFQIDKPYKKLKTFVIDSTYLTSAEIDYKIVYTLRALCYEFKGISIFDVFNNIAVIVNQSNSHWFLVLVKREKQDGIYYLNFHILDSMSGNKQKYMKISQKIFNLLTYHLELEDYRFEGVKNIFVENVLQQNDGYSCGDHTCYFLQQLFEENGKQTQNKEEVQKMREKIAKLIFNK